MWNELSIRDRTEYRRMILAFASLTEMFAQKAEDGANTGLSPIINSKYQETVFQRVFGACAEDIGNTSYDASIALTNGDGHVVKYLIGIKTFGFGAGAQKVAQFKANHDSWAEEINAMRVNALDEAGRPRSKSEISEINRPLYAKLARDISYLRNLRIDSSESNAQGFSVSIENDDVRTVYHVLMPSKKGDPPSVFVGEMDYDRIDTANIQILGCTSAGSPTNFEFTDGRHRYKYTSADSQLYMDFDNKNIVCEKWDVRYADDAYSIFADIADRIYPGPSAEPHESYSWKITNKNGEVEMFSGFNSFYGVGSKMALGQRLARIERIRAKYTGLVDGASLGYAMDCLTDFLMIKASSAEEKKAKAALREDLVGFLDRMGNSSFREDMLKVLYRPRDEIYIPIPDSVKFHTAHPDFFNTGVGRLICDNGKWKLPLPKEKCRFTLVFEPSGDRMESFITQDAGKAIESCEKQTYLGEWILRKVFQLKEYEPLTSKRLKEVGINGIRLEKYPGTDEVHLHFIWIDDSDLPPDYTG